LEESLLIGLASIIILGNLAQWLAWRLSLPSILLLLIFGLIAGPVSGILKPDILFGELLFPFVSVSVAIILFEGGLSLRLDELKQVGKVVRNLTTIGILITWVLSAVLAHFVAGIEWTPAVLLGAILVVSGPTVIIPLLRQVRPVGNIGSIVKWEGIVNDPIGAILAVLVFEVIVSGGLAAGYSAAIFGVLKALIFGSLIGVLAAAVIVILLKKYLIPDFLQNPVALMMVVMCYAAANAIMSETGLLAVTVMGVALANQRFVSIRQITEFKEALRVLLISSLFIILAAKVTVDQLATFNILNWIFVILLIVLVRPAMVFLSTYKINLKRKEKLFLSWMAPRGIVAAAVSSVFALRLGELGYENADKVVILTFQVIIGTVAVYGLTASPVARFLKLAEPNPQGVLFAGAAPWARALAKILLDEGYEVRMVDSNWENTVAARSLGIRSYYGNILSENILNDISLAGVGKLFAVTPNDEVNALAAMRFTDIFGRSEIYQLRSTKKKSDDEKDEMAQHLRGRSLFGNDVTFSLLNEQYYSGFITKKTPITEEFTFERFKEMYGDSAIPLAVIRESGNLGVFTVDSPLVPKAGETIISLVKPPEDIKLPESKNPGISKDRKI